MTKQSGIGDRAFVDGYDVSGDVGSIGRLAGGPAPLDVTDITQGGYERIGGVFDGTGEFTAYFNTDADRAHDVLSGLPTGHRTVQYCRGTALGAAAAGLVAKQIGYDPSRAADGMLTIGITTQASNGTGLEWGRQLTAGIRTDVAATNGSSVDLGSASPGAFGLVAYLHVFDFDGTDVTVKIQESSDNGVGDAWADVVGGAFTVIAADRVAQRIATGAINVERYLRAVTTTAAGFVTCSFSVMAVRYDTVRKF